MMDIIDKIKALPDGKTLLYAVMTGMQVEGYNSAHFTTDDLKALVAEVERLRAVANAVFDFLDANCDDREIVDQLREALAGTEKV